MNSYSSSEFFDNLNIIYKKKFIFLLTLAISFSIFFILINYIIQSTGSKKSFFLLSLNNNQEELINNYFFLKNIKNIFDEDVYNEIIKNNLPAINSDSIIDSLSLDFKSNYLEFLENSINYSFYLENKINYLKDEENINKNLPIIQKFFEKKDSTFRFEFERFDNTVMRIKVFAKDASNIKNNQDILLQYLKLAENIFKKKLQYTIEIIIDEYRLMLQNYIYAKLEELKSKYNKNILKIEMFQDLIKDETNIINLEKLPFHYDNELTKLENRNIQYQIKNNNFLIDKISNTEIDFGILDKKYLLINMIDTKSITEERINILKFSYNVFIIAFLFSFFISVFSIISLHNFQKYHKQKK